jgi:4a-hydroxytetrahydrobiopterin dehydratase
VTGRLRGGFYTLADAFPARWELCAQQASEFHLSFDSGADNPVPLLTTMPDLLKAQDITDWLKKLPEWDLEKNHIERTFEFDDFTAAMDFVNSVADIAENEEHHPEIDIRYNKVRLQLSTHAEGGLTDRDFEVASKIDNLAE